MFNENNVTEKITNLEKLITELQEKFTKLEALILNNNKYYSNNNYAYNDDTYNIKNEVNLENKLLQSTLVIVILTDGYVEDDWGGNWEYPTLWAVTTRHNTSPHGKTIHIDE